MVCENYNRLSHVEKIVLIGQLVHVLQSSNKYFEILTDTLNQAQKEGELSRVKILPENNNNEVNY